MPKSALGARLLPTTQDFTLVDGNWAKYATKYAATFTMVVVWLAPSKTRVEMNIGRE